MRSIYNQYRVICLFAVSILLLFSFKTPNTSTALNSAPVSSYLSEKQFNELFPLRDKFYSYSAFIKAIRQIGHIRIKVAKRAVSVYQITRTCLLYTSPSPRD